jgi:hypothetical protein
MNLPTIPVTPRNIAIALGVVGGVLLLRRRKRGAVAGPARRRVLPGGGTPVASKSLKTLHPTFQTSVRKLMERMKARGFQPAIGTSWRNLAWQQQAVDDGRSKVHFSMHNATDMESGAPAALAVDLVDRRYGWGGTKAEPAASDNPRTIGAAQFFKALGQEASKLGLGWGGNYSHKGIWSHFGMGWDVAHVSWKPETRSLLASLERGQWPAGLGPVEAVTV